MGLQYVARKPLKVGGRTVQPGEVVPEAAEWKNVRAYVNDGSLAVAVEVSEGDVENTELKDLQERVAALEALLVGSGEIDDDSHPVDPVPSDPEAEATETVSGFLDADHLNAIKRPDLNEMAREMGVEDPESFRTKDELIARLVTIPVSGPAEGEDAS